MAGVALAACAPAPTPTAAPKPTEAPKPAAPTEAPKPTDVPKPTAVPPTVAPTVAPTATAKPKPTIKLAENSWTGSSANVYVAKQLIEDKLGYKVEIVTIDENAQWAAISNNDISASLELWPSGHAESYEKFIKSTKTVDDIGKLGVVGKISWYVPSYLVKDKPEMATWEGIKKNATLFKTAETGNFGRFLTGDPAWVQYDEPIIKNLGMNLKVVKAGSEEAVLAAVDKAYAAKQPILFYFWTPHSVHAKYELTPVKLPDYSDACGAFMDDKKQNSKVNCDYPPDVLYKIASPKLKEQAPDVYEFLKNFNYGEKDQIAIIADVELNKKKTAEAAKAWVDQNEKVWSAWLPKK